MTDHQYILWKTRLPRGLSYPLGRSSLDHALTDAGVYDSVWAVNYQTGWNDDDGRYRLISAIRNGDHDHGGSSGLVHLHVYAVPSEHRQELSARMSNDGLPRLIDWMSSFPSMPETWRDTDQHFGFLAKPDPS